MKKLVIKTQYNNSAISTYKGEINKQPSKTLPDQSMSIAEIVKRYNNGMPVTGQNVVFHGEEFIPPDLSKMDLSEIHEMQKKVKADIDEIKQRVAKARKERYWKEVETQFRKKFADEQASEQPVGQQSKAPQETPTVPL